jgi:hypothetical protein
MTCGKHDPRVSPHDLREGGVIAERGEAVQQG